MSTRHQAVSLIVTAMTLAPTVAPQIHERSEISRVKWERDIALPVSDHQRVPVWAWGALVVLASNHTEAPVFRTVDRDGNLVSRVIYSLPGAYRIDVYDFTRGPDGMIALCGAVRDPEGRSAAVIGIVSASGQVAETVRVMPYIPERIAVAADGTLWTAGEEYPLNPNAAVLRHFDRSGKLVGAFLPRSGFPTSRMTMRASFIRAAPGRVGWYSGPNSGSEAQYVEVSNDGSVKRFAGAALGQGSKLTGLALTDNGGTFVSTEGSSWAAWTILSLSRDTGFWQQVEIGMPTDRKATGLLYGADGGHLVARTRDRLTASYFSVGRP